MLQLRRFLAPLFMIFAFTVIAGCSVASGDKTAGEFVDDSVITTRVKAAIIEDPELKVMDIKVKTYKGEVQLSGFVESRASANRAVEVARGVHGVRKVNNDMQVK